LKLSAGVTKSSELRKPRESKAAPLPIIEEKKVAAVYRDMKPSKPPAPSAAGGSTKSILMRTEIKPTVKPAIIPLAELKAAQAEQKPVKVKKPGRWTRFKTSVANFFSSDKAPTPEADKIALMKKATKATEEKRKKGKKVTPLAAANQHAREAKYHQPVENVSHTTKLKR